MALDRPTTELVRLARATLGSLPDAHWDAGLKVVQARLDARRPSRSPIWAWGFAAALTLAVGGSGVRAWLHQAEPPALTFRTEGVALADDGYVRASADAPASVYFSDGTVIALSEGARARITSVDGRGARLVLEDGQLGVAVEPNPHARWRFDAGPFQVVVKGTQFRLSWSGAEGRLQVQLTQGSVAVSGPLSQEPIALRTGQQLNISLSSKQVILDTFVDPAASVSADNRELPIAGLNSAAPTGEVPPSEGTGDSATIGNVPGPIDERQPPLQTASPQGGKARGNAVGIGRMSRTPTTSADGPDRSHRPSAVRRGSAEKDAPSRSWSTDLAEGHLQTILDDARQRGLETALETCTSSDLAVLADAARYKGHNDIAERALVKQRARFAGSTRAHDAAFLLGRLQEARGVEGLTSAIAWYDRYLSEKSNGTYAAEALGRKMTAMERLYGADRARPTAERYLERYPTGAYAPAARALLRTR